MVARCYAGRKYRGGIVTGPDSIWKFPCQNFAIHGISIPGGPPLYLCDDHFQQISSVGLVEEEDIGKEEFDRREHIEGD